MKTEWVDKHIVEPGVTLWNGAITRSQESKSIDGRFKIYHKASGYYCIDFATKTMSDLFMYMHQLKNHLQEFNGEKFGIEL